MKLIHSHHYTQQPQHVRYSKYIVSSIKIGFWYGYLTTLILTHILNFFLPLLLISSLGTSSRIIYISSHPTRVLNLSTMSINLLLIPKNSIIRHIDTPVYISRVLLLVQWVGIEPDNVGRDTNRIIVATNYLESVAGQVGIIDAGRIA